MINKKSVKCPFCTKKYVTKESLYEHMENNHEEQLEGLTACHYYFDYRNKNKTHKGKCTECGKEVEFNEKTEKYNRLCNNPKCKENYVAKFRARMAKKGKSVYDLRDPEKQKQMLAARKISGVYKWSDGKNIPYTGTYEKDCLEYLDKVLQYPSCEVISPAPQIYKYKVNGKEHFYIPDIYLADLNLLIEIKGHNNHYQKRDYGIEVLKEEAVMEDVKAKKINYIKVYDKKYDELVEKINDLREEK